MSQCYSVARTVLDPSYQPCDAAAAASPCCQLNHTTPDVCLSTALCLSTRDEFAGTLWGNGCTDREGADVACPQICKGLVNATEFWSVMQCPEEGRWCCREWANWESCCDDPARVVSLRSRDVTERVLEEVGGDGDGDRSALVGGVVGGVMGLFILGLLGVIFWLYRKRGSLKGDSVSEAKILPPLPPQSQGVQKGMYQNAYATSGYDYDSPATSNYTGRSPLQEVDGATKNKPVELYNDPVELMARER